MENMRYTKYISLEKDKYFNLNKKLGRHAKPNNTSPKGMKGGIQFLKTSWARDLLLGLNTKINMIGGYDNDVVCRLMKKKIVISDFYDTKDKIFCIHLPHVKYRNLGDLLDEGVIAELKQINGKLAYRKEPSEFIWQEERVVGPRIIDGGTYFGNLYGNLFKISNRKDLKEIKGFFGL